MPLVYGGPISVGSSGAGAWRTLDKASAGVVESTDGGAAWSAPVALPKELKGVNALTWLEYDPTADTLYVMKMGSELYALRRGSR